MSCFLLTTSSTQRHGVLLLFSHCCPQFLTHHRLLELHLRWGQLTADLINCCGIEVCCLGCGLTRPFTVVVRRGTVFIFDSPPVLIDMLRLSATPCGQAVCKGCFCPLYAFISTCFSTRDACHRELAPSPTVR